MYLLGKVVQPMEQLAIWGEGFTNGDCDQIKAVGELLEFEQARVGGDKSLVSKDIRDTAVTWISHRENSDFIYRRMNEIAAHVNFHKFQYDLVGFTELQYTKYGVGGHYDWHLDTGEIEGDYFRKLTFVLMLSDESEYEGGDLLLNTGGKQETANQIRLKKGEVIAFPSHTPHKVIPVTKGERITLVCWLKGPKLK